LTGEPVVGQSVTVDVTGGKPSTAGLLIGSFQSLDIPLAGGRLLVDPSPGAILINVGVNGSGELSLSTTLPDDDLLIGTTIFMQYVLFDDSQPFDLALSNGLEVVFCDS
jgi:hypothetical protein